MTSTSHVAGRALAGASRGSSSKAVPQPTANHDRLPWPSKAFPATSQKKLQLCLLQSDKLELFHKIVLSFTKLKKKNNKLSTRLTTTNTLNHKAIGVNAHRGTAAPI